MKERGHIAHKFESGWEVGVIKAFDSSIYRTWCCFCDAERPVLLAPNPAGCFSPQRALKPPRSRSADGPGRLPFDEIVVSEAKPNSVRPKRESARAHTQIKTAHTQKNTWCLAACLRKVQRLRCTPLPSADTTELLAARARMQTSSLAEVRGRRRKPIL